MKLKHSLPILGLVAMLGLGVGVGLASEKAPVEEAKAEDVYWCYAGASTNWTNSATTFKEGGSGAQYTFTAYVNDQTLTDGIGKKVGNVDGGFKIKKTNNWDGALVTVNGSASSLFGVGENGNIVYNGTSNDTFTVSVSGGQLYIDFYQNGFVYIGSAHDWTEDSTKTVNVGSSLSNVQFSMDEQFKFRYGGNWTDGKYVGLGYANLSDKYHDNYDNDDYACNKCFSNNGENVYVRFTSYYDVSLSVVNHELSFTITVHSKVNETVYLLDMHGNHAPTKAHLYHEYTGQDSNTWKIGTTWSGQSLGSPTGRIYTCTFWNIYEKVVFNANSNEFKTADLTIESGKCFVLSNKMNWSGKWIEKDAAQFIDNYMLFNVYDENTYNDEETGVTNDCDANWELAKAAYNALGGEDLDAGNELRKEVLKIDAVADRLGNWASAHNTTINPNGAKIASRTQTIINTYEQHNSNASIVIIVTASTVSLLAVAGYFFLKRKEDR